MPMHTLTHTTSARQTHIQCSVQRIIFVTSRIYDIIFMHTTNLVSHTTYKRSNLGNNFGSHLHHDAQTTVAAVWLNYQNFKISYESIQIGLCVCGSMCLAVLVEKLSFTHNTIVASNIQDARRDENFTRIFARYRWEHANSRHAQYFVIH